jgi:chromosomal replication initiation ATPase DnaA
MCDNSTFIKFLSEYSKPEHLTKIEYENIIKEIDSNFLNNDVNIFSYNNNNIITNECCPNLSEILKYGNTGNILLDSKSNEIKRLAVEYNYIKKYNNDNAPNILTNQNKKKKCFIDCKINDLSDLIILINKNEYCADTEYNIDLKSLHNIKTELIELNSMIGLKNIKNSILEQLLYFLQKLHVDENGNDDYKHMVLYGPPGTGKTDLAKILGKMYSKVGLLSKNIFKKTTRSDFIAGYLGQTAIKTDKLIKECLGGVLFIDEAYALGHEDKSTDCYSKECLDTLNEALSNYKNDLIVIMAGYEKEIEETIFKTNIGLKSRFIWRFDMEAYNETELYQIFNKMVFKMNWKLNTEVTHTWFSNKMTDFGSYGRDMESLLTHVKISHSRRLYGSTDVAKYINLDDMNSGFNRYLINRDKKKDTSYLNGLYV